MNRIPACAYCNRKNKKGKSLPGMPTIYPHCESPYAAVLCGMRRVALIWSFLDKQRAS